MSETDIFSELNEVLARPQASNRQNLPRSNPSLSSSLDTAIVQRIGYHAAKFLAEASAIGPLAPPTRLRDNRMRLDANMIYSPNTHSDGNFFSSQRG